MAGNWFDEVSANQAIPPGTRVGAYTIGDRLGAGAMGAVYRAHDDGGGEVALKIIHPDFDADPTARELMAQEVAALQRLRHRNVARVLDAELDGSEAFVVTELITGKTLAQEVAGGGPLDAQDLFELAEQLGAALLALETAGIVHRDIKPSNIIVSDNGPVLIDFGIAQELTADVEADPASRLMGTPGYLAPELLTGTPPTSATDWWSWAAVLAFAGTGRPPFGYGAAEEVFHRALQGRVDLVGLPPRTAAALLGALSAEPGERTSPAEVILALRRDAAAASSSPTQVIAPVPAAYPTQVLPPLANVTPHQPAQLSVPGGTQVMPAVGVMPAGLMPAVGPDATAVIDWHATQVLPPQAINPMPAAAALVSPPPAFGAVPQYPHTAANIPGAHAAGSANHLAALGVGYGTMQPQHLPPGYGPLPAEEPFRVYQRPELPKRTGVLAACAVPLLIAGVQAPLIAFSVFAVAVVMVRIVGTFVNDLHLRRELAGEARNSDAAVVAARSPLTLIRGIVGSLPQLLVGLGVGLLLMALGWWATGESGPLPIAGDWLHQAILGFAMLAAMLITWFGTHSYLTRYGARSVLNTIAPGRGGIVLIILAALLALYLLYGLLVEPTGDINWWPGGPPPLL